MEKIVEMKMHPALMSELGRNLYSNRFSCIKEIIINAYDNDATEVRISFDGIILTINDNGTGMTARDIEEKYLVLGSPHKKEQEVSSIFNRKIVGQKGIGKLGILSLADEYSIISTSDNEVNQCTITNEKLEVPILSKKRTKEKKGTIVILTLKQKENVNSFLQSLYYYLSEMLGYLLLKHPEFNVYIDYSIGPKKVTTYLPKGQIHKIRRHIKEYNHYDGLLVYTSFEQKPKKRILILCQKDVGVEKVRTGCNRLFGYLNADFIHPTTNRESYIPDHAYMSIKKEIESILSKFRPDKEDIDKSLYELAKQLKKLMNNAFKELDIKYEGPVPMSETSETETVVSYIKREKKTKELESERQPTSEEKNPNYDHSKVLDGLKRNNPLKLANGFILKIESLGSDAPASDFSRPNAISFNKDHEIVKSMLTEESKHGKMNILIGLASRCFAQLDKGDPTLDDRIRNLWLEQDRITLHCLK
jgi:hypothetical protein